MLRYFWIQVDSISTEEMSKYKTNFLQWTVSWLTAVSVSVSYLEVSVNQDILLSCPCSCPIGQQRINLRWQRGEVLLLFQEFNLTTEKGYENRVKLFTNQHKDNCSLLLSQITVADNGIYTCYFYCQALEYESIKLKVVADYTVCMNFFPIQDSVGSNQNGMYQCKAFGGYPIGQIHWKLNGHLLNGDHMDNYQDNSTGLYTLKSSLTIELNKSIDLVCLVKREDRVYHANSSLMCNDGKPEPRNSPKVVLSVGVAVVAVAGFLLVIFLLTRRHHRAIPTMVFFKQQSEKVQDIKLAEPLNADED
ncbi:hypothetical protein DPEC_G00053290 [Dallia pectoralis]|uniref:Uncharacterized protein n=1 Tax=Dallia pectoralis TaxID=75939 RepID=A0ACC2HCH3_DALPE|nr:hypothetical protein DPEC_G00053290 [Dallia pectoralis]